MKIRQPNPDKGFYIIEVEQGTCGSIMWDHNEENYSVILYGDDMFEVDTWEEVIANVCF